MSVQQIHLLTTFPQADPYELSESYFDSLRYFATRLCSCWHLRLSRPFTHERESYRACLRCGMRRKFDLQNWKSIGRFYPPTVERRSVR